jgi:hypothetical protein
MPIGRNDAPGERIGAVAETSGRDEAQRDRGHLLVEFERQRLGCRRNCGSIGRIDAEQGGVGKGRRATKAAGEDDEEGEDAVHGGP